MCRHGGIRHHGVHLSAAICRPQVRSGLCELLCRQRNMAAPAFRKCIHSAAILVCVLLAAAAVQSCAATSQTQSATRPHAKKRPHRPPTRKSRAKHVTVKPHPKPRRKPARKAVPRKAIAARKPAAKPAANKRIAATFPRVATVEQVLVRNCGTPSLNQTTRVAVHDRLQPRINQLEQGRAAPVTVRVFFAIIQASHMQMACPYVHLAHEDSCVMTWSGHRRG